MSMNYNSRRLAVSLAAMAVVATNPLPVRRSFGQSSAAPTATIFVNHLTLDDVEVAAQLISRAFPRSSPHSWSRALGLHRSLEGYMRSYLPTPIQTPNLGCYAARVGTGKDSNSSTRMIGTLILEFLPSSSSEDSNLSATSSPRSRPPENDDDQSAAYEAIDGIMNECKSIFRRELQLRHRDDYAVQKGHVQCGYVAWIAVEDQFRGIGVASTMIEHGKRRLQASGCRFAVAFTVSPTAMRVFQRSGFDRWGYVKYRDYELDGSRPFQILPDEVSVMVCDLGSSINKTAP